jgi:hypothetical protein
LKPAHYNAFFAQSQWQPSLLSPAADWGPVCSRPQLVLCSQLVDGTAQTHDDAADSIHTHCSQLHVQLATPNMCVCWLSQQAAQHSLWSPGYLVACPGMSSCSYQVQLVDMRVQWHVQCAHGWTCVTYSSVHQQRLAAASINKGMLEHVRSLAYCTGCTWLQQCGVTAAVQSSCCNDRGMTSGRYLRRKPFIVGSPGHPQWHRLAVCHLL